tara:strand:+ start:96 stop:266 length:171 start_codon:yes stop_codon:yes gene_type:complete
MTKDYDEILENLNKQKKQAEIQFIKIEVAIDIITSIKNDIKPPEEDSEEDAEIVVE